MTLEGLLDAVSDKKLIIYRGMVFFNERDAEEAQRWREIGCRIIPWYEEDEIIHRQRRGFPSAQGYEVHLLGAVDPIWELDEDGDEVEITAAALLANARARVAA